ncbi:protein trapped in endoderm-1-like [Ylistrum balloti]|uniref:protein trapped in endoderm-1-like n=1 Tax=Ylistrum balloti TaxID=509963 RepID=UPI0029059D66|nr:protein trapped in endoderm-1-like [Ylistrum balloti]
MVNNEPSVKNIELLNILQKDSTDQDDPNLPLYAHRIALIPDQNHAMDQSAYVRKTYHQEAYYLYFVAVVGLLLNLLVVIFVFVRRSMRKLTSAFLIHASFLDFLKAAYCIPIANNLVTQLKPMKSDCNFFGATYVLIITASVFNMLAMVCTEAYTFGEVNIGGNSKGSLCCVVFGTLLVYIASIILHLGPTLIGGYFDFHPEIGSCAFPLGKQTGYVANMMWIGILTLTLIGIVHFICKLYKEIQVNHTNRVSMLVRSSITIMDDPVTSVCNVQTMINESSHRARLFILSTISFILCWYPLFLLMLVDVHFTVSPKVYQAFSFIAWSQGTIQPLLYICFDRHVNLLAKYVYCDRYRQYSLANLAGWMNRDPSALTSTTASRTVHGSNRMVNDPCHLTVNDPRNSLPCSNRGTIDSHHINNELDDHNDDAEEEDEGLESRNSHEEQETRENSPRTFEYNTERTIGEYGEPVSNPSHNGND